MLFSDVRGLMSRQRDSIMKPGSVNRNPSKLKDRVDAYERVLVVEALRSTRGNQSRAAVLLGTSQRIVNYKINKYNIDVRQFR
jgi:Nif-specific regulatory protein